MGRGGDPGRWVAVLQGDRLPGLGGGSVEDPDEIRLFDRDGHAVAYVAVGEELTIYLRSGHPVAYLHPRGSYSCIYGFNGRHLGWLEDGLVRDAEGEVVGSVEGEPATSTDEEVAVGRGRVRRLRRLRPLPSLRRMEPLKPLYRDRWSSTPLWRFLAAGRRVGYGLPDPGL